MILKPTVVHIISSLNRGGRERQLATIYKYSDRNTLTNKIVCFNRTSNSYIEEYKMYDDIIYLSSKNFLKRFIELRRIISSLNAQLIWSWGILEATFSLLISVTSEVKHINGSIRHGIVLFNRYQLWRLLILHLSKNIVANSKAGLKANKLKRGIILYNGIDDLFFIKNEKQSQTFRNEFNINSKTVLLISIANLVPYKDYTTLLYSLNKIKSKGISFHFIGIGEGLERQKIENLIESLDLSQNVTFPGLRSNVRDVLYASDLFIHSSLGEGCSNAILEAMASGIPIIASDTGGTAEIVDDSIGRLFQFQNVTQLTERIEELIANPHLRKSLGKNARLKAKNDFSVERMMVNYNKIIADISSS